MYFIVLGKWRGEGKKTIKIDIKKMGKTHCRAMTCVRFESTLHEGFRHSQNIVYSSYTQRVSVVIVMNIVQTT